MTLDQLAEQAAKRVFVPIDRIDQTKRIIREALEAAYKQGEAAAIRLAEGWHREFKELVQECAGLKRQLEAQREQLEQAQRLSSLLQATLDDVSEQLAQVTQERDVLQRQLRSYKAALS